MGKPAARMGDQTAHGGVITAGAPTVLIGGKPAARLGDMTSCPMATPAPVPVPHVGGPITLGSAGVLICGMPAARMGDQAICPPMGPAPIVMGEFTVLIGETGGGAGGGAGGMGAAGAFGAVAAAAATAVSGAGVDSAGAQADSGADEADEGHSLDVSFVDKGGHPITGVRYSLSGPENTAERGQLMGGVKKTGIPAGDYEIKLSAITAASWSEARHLVGEEVKLQVSTAGIENGTHAVLEIFRRDTNAPEELVHTIEASVDGDAVEGTWNPEVSDELLAHQDDFIERGRYSNPFYVFKVSVGSLNTYSSLMQLRDKLEVTVKDDEGEALAKRELRIFFPNGEIRMTKTDTGGKVVEDDVPCGRFRISLDVRT